MLNFSFVLFNRTETWMKCPEMKKLNPFGGYALLKNHLHVAHRIAISDFAKYKPLCNAITDRKIYDHLNAEIR